MSTEDPTDRAGAPGPAEAATPSPSGLHLARIPPSWSVPLVQVSRWYERIAMLAVVCAIYFVSGKFGLRLAFDNPSVSAVWPPTGIALAALLLLGPGVWPAIFVGAFLVNYTTSGAILASFGIAIGNTLEGYAGAWLVNRWAGGRHAFVRAGSIFRFAFLAGLLATTLSASVGVSTLCLSKQAVWANSGSLWVTWWLGDAVGAMILAPLLVLWATGYRTRWNQGQFFEGITLLLCLFLVSEIVFSGLFPLGLRNFTMWLLCIPCLFWAAFRFGPREAATAILVMSAVAIRSTLLGFGPFVKGTQQEALLLVQVFTGVAAVMTLAVAASVTERKRAEERFRLVVESAPSAMVMANAQGKIVLINSQVEKLFGYNREELIGRSVEVLVPERFRARHPADRAEFSARPRARPMGAGRDLFAVRKNGTEFPVEIGLNPIHTEEGLLILSAIADITERKRTEVIAREANEKLRSSVGEMERQTRHIALLHRMSQLLQSCVSAGEAYSVIKQFTEELFPSDSGAICVLNAPVNLVEAVCEWGKEPPLQQPFSPEECWALRRGQVHAVHKSRTSLFCQHLGGDEPEGSLCVPMMAQGEALGILHLRGGAGDPNLSPGARARWMVSRENLAVTVAGHVALALANLRLRETLRIQSIRDPLTGLYNRRYLTEALDREVRRSARNQRPLALLMLDVDHFKTFNDSYGHEAGDMLLRELGSFLLKRTRGEDFACRYGGDEFVIILPEATPRAAERRAAQLRDGITRIAVPHGDRYLTAPTVSVGVAHYPEHGATSEALLRAADEALYRAKSEGRNRIAVGHPSEMD